MLLGWQRDCNIADVSSSLLVGLALSDRAERDVVAAWLATADMVVEVLVEACKVDADVAGRGLSCVVMDESLWRRGFLASLRKHDPRLPVVAVVSASAVADADGDLARAGVGVVARPLDAEALVLAVSLAFGEGRQARSRIRTRTPRVPSRVGGASATILDISANGVRLEVPLTALARLGPQFRLHVPMVALDVVVRRAWVGHAVGGLVQCGARLVNPDAGQMLAWERIMELSGSTVAPPRMRGIMRPPSTPVVPPRLLGRVSRLLVSSLGGWANQVSRG